MLNVVILNVVMLNVIILNVVMLNVVILNVVMLNVVEPPKTPKNDLRPRKVLYDRTGKVSSFEWTIWLK
jgi:hypothetical protein